MKKSIIYIFSTILFLGELSAQLKDNFVGSWVSNYTNSKKKPPFIVDSLFVNTNGKYRRVYFNLNEGKEHPFFEISGKMEIIGDSIEFRNNIFQTKEAVDTLNTFVIDMNFLMIKLILNEEKAKKLSTAR